jgi:long-subunit fatty acid transport protein
MKKTNLLITKCLMLFIGMNALMWACLTASVYGGGEVEIPSSFNPVGSGARALGMGGAFIAVADDATAASWNPGGLTQLRKPECSVVGAFYSRSEDLTFGTNPEADGSHSISDSNINYLSASYPFELLNRNMIVSLSYQHLYDFNREWEFTWEYHPQNTELQGTQLNDNWSYKETGSLNAIGLSYGIRIIPQLSLGVTLNFWNDDLTPNNWKEKYKRIRTGTLGGAPYTDDKYNKAEEHSIDGFNFNFGMLWRINYKCTLGAVFKSPFKTDVEHKLQENDKPDIRDEELEMPMSYGLGFVYNISDNFSISADIYRTEWDECVYKDMEGNETNPVTGGFASDVEATHQIRIGSEYRVINKEKEYLIPIRAGTFYDPGPAEGNPDDFYGIAVGMGFSKNEWFSVDIAYQYRFGNDVGEYLMKKSNFQFSQDMDEHIVYLSLIWYKF